MKGPLRHLLQPIKKFHREKHYASLPYEKVGKLMAELRGHWIVPPNGALRCLICKHPGRAAIEAAYHAYLLAPPRPGPAPFGRDEVTLREIAEQYGLWRSGIKAHFEKHLLPGGPKRYRPIATYALEFLILTAVRKEQSNEVKWVDIDWDNKLWTCTKHKTKTAGKTDENHVVPLSDAAMAILHDMDKLQKEKGVKSEYVFPGLIMKARAGAGKPVGASTLNVFMHRMGWTDITIHGFRSTFRRWAEKHGYEEKDSEMALAHTYGSKTRRAYTREDSDDPRIENRRVMMQDWANYCARTEPLPAKVVPLHQAIA
jgi:integrase